MPFIYNVPFFSIMLSLIGAIITPLFRRGKMPVIINYVILSVILFLNMMLTIALINEGGSFTYMMGHFPAPYGNELRAGPLEALLATVFSIVMLSSIVAGRSWVVRDTSEKKQYYYYVMQNLLFCSMLALIYTNDIFTGYVFIEINTIAACSIIMIRDSEETITATIRYLIMSLLGSGLLLLAIAMLYSITGHLLMENVRFSIDMLVAQGGYRLPLTIIMGMVALSMAVKSALYPFHSWLPDAHSAATTSSSAILSGLVLKGYIVFLIKMIYRTFGENIVQIYNITDILFLLGVAGMIFGSINAMRETHLKRMVAYSSVAQIGYIFLGIGLENKMALMAAIYHIIFHAFTKPMLFISGSALSNVSGHSYHLGRLRGSAHKNLLAGIAFSVGGLAMIGIPLLAGFPSKMFLVMSSIDTGILRTPIAFVSIAISTVLNALYYIPALISIWKRPENANEMKESFRTRLNGGMDIGFTIAMIAFVVFNIVVGIRFPGLRNIIDMGVAKL